MTVTVADLVVQSTTNDLYSKWLFIADGQGLSTTTWRPGDPTRTLAYYTGALFQSYEATVSGFVSGAFLQLAEGDWVFIKAEQDYGTPATSATLASCTGNLVNGGAGVYDFNPGDIVVSNPTTKKTYKNTLAIHLGGSTTVPITVQADEVGSASNAGIGAINNMVTTFSGVTFSNTTSAVADDDETPEHVIERALLSIAATSPNGPADAYEYVALSPQINGGTTTVTKVRSLPDSPTGHMTLYLANDGSATTAGDVTLVQNACAKLCTPLCITPIILAATEQPLAFTYTAWIYDRANLLSADVEALIDTAIVALIKRTPIGGDLIPPATTGSLYASAIKTAIEGAHVDIFRADVSAPAGDTVATGIGYVFTKGTVTPTINFVVSP